jgi:hypothetical protein
MIAAVTARGGDILTVEAQMVAGDLTAKVLDDDLATGGSIRNVESARAIPETVTISATYYVGLVTVVLPGTAVPEMFTVIAEAGATWPQPEGPATVGPLTIAVGASDVAPAGSMGFLGKVHLRVLDDILQAGLADTFSNGDVLLTVKTKNDDDELDRPGA